MKLKLCYLALLTVFFLACSGGGGSDGTAASAGSPNQRSSKTGIRVLHGALDIEPVDIKVADKYLGRVSFMDYSYFSSTGSGLINVALERANSPGVNIYSSPLTLNEKTEYSLLLSGQDSHNNFTVTVLEEPIVRPDLGQGRVQLVNLLEGSAPLVLSGGAVNIAPVPFRLASGYANIASGLQTFSITTQSGGLVGSLTVEVPDRGEVTVLVGGYTSENLIVIRALTDLD